MGPVYTITVPLQCRWDPSLYQEGTKTGLYCSVFVKIIAVINDTVGILI